MRWLLLQRIALNQFEEIRGPERKTRPHSRVTGQGKQDEELKE
jgi:hypothetical protein